MHNVRHTIIYEDIYIYIYVHVHSDTNMLLTYQVTEILRNLEHREAHNLKQCYNDSLLAITRHKTCFMTRMDDAFQRHERPKSLTRPTHQCPNQPIEQPNVPHGL